MNISCSQSKAASLTPLPDGSAPELWRQVPVGLGAFDARLQLACCNPAFATLCGASQAELRGSYLLHILPLEESRLASVMAALKLRGRWQGMARDEQRTVRIELTRHTLSDGDVCYPVSVIDYAEDYRQLREQSEARELAERTDRAKSQFLSHMSHELRTPLNAILGFTHLLESEDEGPLTFEAREALATIRTSGEHLKTLIDDILDLSAMETGQVRLTRTVVDLFALAEEVVRETRATVKRRPVTLAVAGDRAVFAWADPRRMRQVLTNLVTNAVKATAAGQIQVTVRKHDDRALVEIVDSGRGIAPEVLSTIFEPYKQAGDEVARRGGAGLGLAITRRLVLLHGGTIEAESEPGRGSTFRLRLPDETHSARVPRDSLVPFSEAVDLEGR